MSDKEKYLDCIKKELEMTGFAETDFGKSMMETLSHAYDMSNGKVVVMRRMIGLLPRAVDNLPLSPILSPEENPEEWDDEGNGIVRSKRYPSLWIMDEQARDDHAIAFKPSIQEEMESYTWKSQKFVDLPYFPLREYRIEDQS